MKSNFSRQIETGSGSREMIWRLTRSVLFNRRILFVGCTLLLLVFIDSRLPCGLNPFLDELDTLEHFLFGFVLSDIASETAAATKLSGFLERKLGLKDSGRTDLLVRLAGFLLVGGLLWELSELYVFPRYGTKPDSFFSFPITLDNVDGAIDVTVGIIGCSLAWLQTKKR